MIVVMNILRAHVGHAEDLGLGIAGALEGDAGTEVVQASGLAPLIVAKMGSVTTGTPWANAPSTDP